MNENELKSTCDVIQDLLPLYQDDICSQTSKKIIEEHLNQCTDCKLIADKLKNTTFDNQLVQEKNTILEAHAKKEKTTAVKAGLLTSCVLLIPLIVCLICNLAIGHSLNWFFIVLTSLMVFASVTVVPLITSEHTGLWTIGSFTVSVILLLFVISLYTHGNWFLIAAIPTLFGISLICIPYIIKKLPLPNSLANRKGLLIMGWNTLWVYIIVIVCGFYIHDYKYWLTALSITTISITLPWFIFFVIRYLRIPTLIKIGLITIAIGLFQTFGNDFIGFCIDRKLRLSIFHADFSNWSTDYIDSNVGLIVFLSCLLIGLLLMGISVILQKNDANK